LLRIVEIWYSTTPKKFIFVTFTYITIFKKQFFDLHITTIHLNIVYCCSNYEWIYVATTFMLFAFMSNMIPCFTFSKGFLSKSLHHFEAFNAIINEVLIC